VIAQNSESELITHEERNDQVHYQHRYDHGRMPAFMKFVWIGFIVLMFWYVSRFLLDAVGAEIGG
jgi:hypothetical protein